MPSPVSTHALDGITRVTCGPSTPGEMRCQFLSALYYEGEFAMTWAHPSQASAVRITRSI
jgi:hypothetical protein